MTESPVTTTAASAAAASSAEDDAATATTKPKGTEAAAARRRALIASLAANLPPPRLSTGGSSGFVDLSPTPAPATASIDPNAKAKEDLMRRFERHAAVPNNPPPRLMHSQSRDYELTITRVEESQDDSQSSGLRAKRESVIYHQNADRDADPSQCDRKSWLLLRADLEAKIAEKRMQGWQERCRRYAEYAKEHGLKPDGSGDKVDADTDREKREKEKRKKKLKAAKRRMSDEDSDDSDSDDEYAPGDALPDAANDEEDEEEGLEEDASGSEGSSSDGEDEDETDEEQQGDDAMKKNRKEKAAASDEDSKGVENEDEDEDTKGTDKASADLPLDKSLTSAAAPAVATSLEDSDIAITGLGNGFCSQVDLFSAPGESAALAAAAIKPSSAAKFFLGNSSQPALSQQQQQCGQRLPSQLPETQEPTQYRSETSISQENWFGTQESQEPLIQSQLRFSGVSGVCIAPTPSTTSKGAAAVASATDLDSSSLPAGFSQLLSPTDSAAFPDFITQAPLVPAAAAVVAAADRDEDSKDDDDGEDKDLALMLGLATQNAESDAKSEKKESESESSSDEESEDSEDSAESDQSERNVSGRRKKTRRTFVESDDDSDASDSEGENDGKDSEASSQREEGISRDRRRLRQKDFLEEEAELSGSDADGGEDNDEDNEAVDAALAAELEGMIDDDEEALGGESQIHRQVAKIRHAMEIDEDRRQVDRLKEFLLPDGEFADEGDEDGVGRKWRFNRWKELRERREAAEDAAVPAWDGDGVDEEQRRREEAEQEAEAMAEQALRIERHKREQFLEQQQQLQDQKQQHQQSSNQKNHQLLEDSVSQQSQFFRDMHARVLRESSNSGFGTLTSRSVVVAPGVGLEHSKQQQLPLQPAAPSNANKRKNFAPMKRAGSFLKRSRDSSVGLKQLVARTASGAVSGGGIGGGGGGGSELKAAAKAEVVGGTSAVGGAACFRVQNRKQMQQQQQQQQQPQKQPQQQQESRKRSFPGSGASQPAKTVIKKAREDGDRGGRPSLLSGIYAAAGAVAVATGSSVGGDED